jgi:hypothetical protein
VIRQPPRRGPPGIARRLAILACLLACPPLAAQPPTYDIRIRDHLFEPAELTIPANTKVRLAVHNLDPTPEEFESWEMNREKVILGGQTATIFVGPLPPGEYPFFGEFNPKTAQGRLVVR